LETELETRDREMEDFRAVIRNNELQLVQMESQIRDSQQENQRLHILRQNIDEDYMDQIAILRMELSREVGSRRGKIEEAKQKLELQRQAKTISSANFDESREILQSRRGELCEKLNLAQSIAMQFRDEILETDKEETALTAEIAQMRSEIAGLKRHCEALVRKGEEDQGTLGESIEDLNQQYQEAVEELEQAKKLIEQYNAELLDQDGRIDILARELALSQQRYQTTLSAFKQDEEVPL
jgi:chromosome segregation ATPase